MSKYTIGVDFGTESGRAVLVDVTNGKEIATAVYPYSNGVIDENLPGTQITLEPDWALQDPQDYIRVFQEHQFRRCSTIRSRPGRCDRHWH